MDTPIKISVIVCTKNRSLELVKLLKSLNCQSVLPDELIIVDASNDNKTSTLINKMISSSNFLLKYLKTEPGLTRQRNIGVKASRGKYLYFFDDDVVLDNNFIKIIYETFLKFEDQNIGGITGRITNISRKIEPVDWIFKKLFFLTDHGKGKLKPSGFPSHCIDNKLATVEVLHGGCTAYKHEVLLNFSFDENLADYSYMEDVDFSYRVSKKYKLIYQPEAKLKHFATTYKTANSRILRKMLIRNHFYLFKKNHPKDFSHLFSFILSIIGLFIYNALLAKDIRACIGIMEGIVKPLKL